MSAAVHSCVFRNRTMLALSAVRLQPRYDFGFPDERSKDCVSKGQSTERSNPIKRLTTAVGVKGNCC